MATSSPHQRMPAEGQRYSESPQISPLTYQYPIMTSTATLSPLLGSGSRPSRFPTSPLFTTSRQTYDDLVLDTARNQFGPTRWDQNGPWNPVQDGAHLSPAHMNRSRGGGHAARSYAASDGIQQQHPDTESIISESIFTCTTGTPYTAPTEFSTYHESPGKQNSPSLHRPRSAQSGADQSAHGCPQGFVGPAQVNRYCAGATSGDEDGYEQQSTYSPTPTYGELCSWQDGEGRMPPALMEVQQAPPTYGGYGESQSRNSRYPHDGLPSAGLLASIKRKRSPENDFEEMQARRSRHIPGMLLTGPAASNKRRKTPGEPHRQRRTGRRTDLGGDDNNKGRERRPFHCVFYFAGCRKDFATKNEWKRHVSSQHIQDKVWICDMVPCGDRSSKKMPSTFNRKDLFGQHLKRMHGPDSQHKTTNDITRNQASPQMNEFVTKEIPVIQDRCCNVKRELPLSSLCGFCAKRFVGPGSWDDRMEHVGRHYENAAATTENVNPGCWTPDQGLIDWAVRERIVVRGSDGAYTLGKVGKDAVMGSC